MDKALIDYSPWYTPAVEMHVCGKCGAMVPSTHTDVHTEWHLTDTNIVDERGMAIPPRRKRSWK